MSSSQELQTHLKPSSSTVAKNTRPSSSPLPTSSMATSPDPSRSRTRGNRGLHLSRSPEDLLIPVRTFCRAFPFHFLCDQDLKLLQIGSGKNSFRSLFSLLTLYSIRVAVCYNTMNHFNKSLEFMSHNREGSFSL